MNNLKVMKKAGSALLVVGLADIAYMIYCISNKISYSSSFNIFAVIAGVALLRGSLRAASIVRWLAALSISCYACLLILWPILQPLNLTYTQIMLNPKGYLVSAVLMVFVFAFLYWLFNELGKEEILEARTSAGKKRRDMRVPFGLGVIVMLGMTIFLKFFLSGESAARALLEAKSQLGEGYQYHMASLNVSTHNGKKLVNGVVIAWSKQEVKYVPIKWEE